MRLSDPARHEIHLRNESKRVLEWLSSCFQHDQLRNMRQSPLLHCMAAADAMTEGDVVGVGGWISTATQLTQVRQFWPMLTKRAQAYISCFETIAQPALAMMALRRCHAKHFKFVLPAASDNTSRQQKQESTGFSLRLSLFATFSNW